MGGDSVGRVFSRAFRIGHIGGVAIRVDLSWFVAAALFAFGFWAFFRSQYGHDPAVAAGLAAAAVLVFFASVLAHELGHALEAQHRGVEVGGITLFLFGGVTETRFDVERPLDEFALSAVGPYVSFVLAAGFGLIATGARMAGWGAVADVTGMLGWLNLVLAIFNLLPGAPLDGGRILRALAWKVTGDRPRAMRFAARAGQVLGGLILLAGLAQAFLAGQLAFGLFNAFIGWFLYAAAGAEHRQAEAQSLLHGRTVGSVASAPPDPLPIDATVGATVETIARSPSDAHPVHEGDEIVGVVVYDDVVRVHRGRGAETRLREIARPLRDLPTMQSTAELGDVVEVLRDGAVVAVLDGGDVVGLLTTSDLERALRRLRDLDGPRTRRGRPADGHLPGDEA